MVYIEYPFQEKSCLSLFSCDCILVLGVINWFLRDFETKNMRLQERPEMGQVDLFKSRLDQLLDIKHPFVQLAKLVDWARLAHRARERSVKQAKLAGLELRQFYPKKSKSDLMSYARYRHAKQFKRARKSFNRLHTYLGRVIRDIERHIEGNEAKQAAFQQNLTLGKRILAQKNQKQGQNSIPCTHPKSSVSVSSRASGGKAHKPYEFGVKVSIATTVHRSKGVQFVLHSDTCPGNPHDGKTLEKILPAIEAVTGGVLKRILADRGYSGSNALPEHKPKVFIQEQKRGMTKELKKLLNRRSCVEPFIGHIKNDHRGTKNHLKGAAGDAINATLEAAGYNFSLLIKWFKDFLTIYYIWMFIKQS